MWEGHANQPASCGALPLQENTAALPTILSTSGMSSSGSARSPSGGPLSPSLLRGELAGDPGKTGDFSACDVSWQHMTIMTGHCTY